MGMIAAFCLGALAQFWSGEASAVLLATTLLRKDIEVSHLDAVRLPNMELRDGKLMADVASIGGVRNFEIRNLSVRFVLGNIVGTPRSVDDPVPYFEMRSGECWFLSGKWIDERESGLKEAMTGLEAWMVTLELTGQYDPYGALEASHSPGNASPAGGERTLTNSTPWRLAFKEPPGLVLAPGGTARGPGNFELAEDGQAFRIVYSPWRDAWEIQTMPNARPRIEVSWPGAPGGGGQWTAVLPDAAIREGGDWDKESWVLEYLKTKCRFDPSEYENWRLDWEGVFDTAVWTTNRCMVQWTRKGEAQARVENTGEVPLKWGKLAIPAGQSLPVPWKEMGQLRREGLRVEPLGRGKTQVSYVFETNWPVAPDTSLGAINRVEIRARLKGPPLVRLENRSGVELRHGNVPIPAQTSKEISLDDGASGKTVKWSLAVVPSAAQRALQDWPGAMEVSFTCPEYGGATNVAVDVTPTDKAPVKLVVTNPGPHDVFATVRGEVLTLKNGERKEWTIPWAEARGKAQTVDWVPIGGDLVDYRGGKREVTFGNAGTTETVECVLARKEMEVKMINVGKIPLQVVFSGEEREIAPGRWQKWSKVENDGSGRTLSIRIAGGGDWTNLWRVEERTWDGEPSLKVKAIVDREKAWSAAENVVEGVRELEETSEFDPVQFTTLGLRRLRGCGLSEIDFAGDGHELPDWDTLCKRVEAGNYDKKLDEEWSLVNPYQSWDDFMRQGKE